MGSMNIKNKIVMMMVLVGGLAACQKNSSSPSQASGLPVLATTAAKPSANQGGVDGGGGEPLKSTKEEVLYELNNIKANYYADFTNLSTDVVLKDLKDLNGKFDIKPTDPKVDLVLRNMLATRDPIFSEDNPLSWSDPKPWVGGMPLDWAISLVEVGRIQNDIAIQIREDGPCEYDGLSRSASTKGKPGSPVCFSVPELQKIAPSALRAQLVALYAHELSHQFGADEPTAQKIQKLAAVRLAFLPVLEANKELIISISFYADQQASAPGTIQNYTAEMLGASGSLHTALMANDYMYDRKLSELNLKGTTFPVEDVRKALADLHKIVNNVEINDVTIMDVAAAIPLLWVSDGQSAFHQNNAQNFSINVTDKTRNLVLDGYSSILYNMIPEIWNEVDKENGI